MVSEMQNNTLKQYKLNGYKCIVSCDCDTIYREIDDYFLGVQIKCRYCNRLFKTYKTLDTRKEVMNEVHNAVLVTGGTVSLTMVAKKVAGMLFGTPESLKGTAKLAVAVGLSTMVVKWAQEKKYLPIDPFKSV